MGLQIQNKALHESRLNNTMLSSSRSTRTRKNIKASSGNVQINFGNDININDADDDEDYNMNDDKELLDEDDEDDDQIFEKITEPLDMTDDDEDDDINNNKNNKNNKNNNDDMIGSDEDEDIDMK